MTRPGVAYECDHMRQIVRVGDAWHHVDGGVLSPAPCGAGTLHMVDVVFTGEHDLATALRNVHPTDTPRFVCRDGEAVVNGEKVTFEVLPWQTAGGGMLHHGPVSTDLGRVLMLGRRP